MRVSLVEPTPTLFLNRTVIYDVLTTQHGILMIYMWALGSALGFSYYLLPSFLKVKKDSMGGYSSAAYWIYLLGAIFIVLSRSSTRWYFYPPLSINLNPYNAGSFNWLAVLGMEMIFVGVVIAAIVVIKMIIMDRDDSIKIEQMSIFAWAVLFTLIMLLQRISPTQFQILNLEGGVPIPVHLMASINRELIHLMHNYKPCSL